MTAAAFAGAAERGALAQQCEVFCPFKPQAPFLTTNMPPGPAAIGDVTGDGKADVIVVGELSSDEPYGTIAVYAQGPGGALAATPVLYRPTPAGVNGEIPEQSIVTGDVNGDGRADVIVTTYGGWGFFPQRSDGTLGPFTAYTSTVGAVVRVGDIDGDGRTDVAVLGGRSDSTMAVVDVYLQASSGGFGARALSLSIGNFEDNDLRIADVNGDGRLDLVVARGLTAAGHYRTLAYPRAAGASLAFGAPIEIGPEADGASLLVPSGIDVGDADGDGLADVVAAAPSALIISYQSAPGVFAPPVIRNQSPYPSAVALRDLDRDGTADIITQGDYDVDAIMGTGARLSPIAVRGGDSSGLNGHDFLAVSDINGDGKLDAVSGRWVSYGTAADVRIDIHRDTPDPVLAGATLTYTVTVTNAGPDSTDNVTVTGAPAPQSYARTTPSQGTCTGTSTGYSCSVGTLAAGASATITAAIDYTSVGTATHDVSVSQYAFDPQMANNSARDTVVVQEAADVSVTATPLNYGQELGWLLTIHNAGPTSASDTVVTLTLPAGTAFAGDVQPVQSGHCEISGRIATCALGTLKASATITIGANIVAESAGTYTLQADAQSPSPDPNLANNHAESTVTAKSASQLPPSQPGPTGTGCACTIGRSGRAIGLPLVLTVLALAALTRRRAG